jgi:L-alanine-DL-glutamate epimerase-like enolase superfamily enzyme
MRAAGAKVERLEVSAYRIPTEAKESDGTLEWNATTLVVAELDAGNQRGLGYTYADAAAATLLATRLREVVLGADAFDVPRVWRDMFASVRNLGAGGICASAIAAVDSALWDLKAKLLGVPLLALLGAARASVPVYGSGGFTSQTTGELARQLGGWAEQGIRSVKMKVGREPERDPERVRAARAAIGPGTGLFVDANGAYAPKQALRMAESFALHEVSWFEEPVPSTDVEGLCLVRGRAPAGMEIAAGEYGYIAADFLRLLDAGAVDVLQADATRCGGITGFMQVSALCAARGVPLSAHTAPALHAAPCCASPAARHVEWFHDHVRIESMLFEGGPRLVDGQLHPDGSRPGLGIELRRSEASRYAL